MKQLFTIGEAAILQSLDAPIEMWNVRVTIVSCKWAEHPVDIFGMPQVATYIYEIDVRDGYFMQACLRKLDAPMIMIKEQEAQEA